MTCSRKGRKAMNDTKIEWATMTWNPVTGCNRGCSYCYARGIARRFGGHIGKRNISNPIKDIPLHDLRHSLLAVRKSGKIVTSPFPFRFEPTFHRYRLDEPFQKKKPQNIFVCSMGDLFGPWVPDKWIKTVFDTCKQAPQHRYLFLTKYPARYVELAKKGELPTDTNFWYGTSYINNLDPIFTSPDHFTFASVEPILHEIKVDGYTGNLFNVDWIIMGAMTGPGREKHRPAREWIDAIAEKAESVYIPVFMKDSLIPIMGEENMKRDFPWE